MRYFAVTRHRTSAEISAAKLDLCADDRIIQRPDLTGDEMENFLEKLMYSSRWIMAPIYLGLSLALL
ncbi:MAG: hypothetical protein R3241_03980, partial [Rheinheimera sp.]|nr:hypothetical protein [Rheinheimera sp.]